MLLRRKSFLLSACIALILISWQFAVSAGIGVGYFWMEYSFPAIVAIAGPLIIYFATGVDKYIKTKSEKIYEEGLKAYDEKDYPKAIQIWRPLADKGYAEAQCRIGEMYEYGICLVKDHKQAFRWYKKAASQGHALSQACLGYMYSLKEKYEEAKIWYEKSAEKGNPEGMNNLGAMYLRGLGGVEIDYNQALKLYRQAADLGLAEAQNNIGSIYYNKRIDEADYEKADYEEEALRWFKQAARQGDINAQYNLASMHYAGEGRLEQSYIHAYKWLYLASKQGDEDSQEAIYVVELHMDDKDIAEAMKLIKKCIETNYEECGEPNEVKKAKKTKSTKKPRKAKNAKKPKNK